MKLYSTTNNQIYNYLWTQGVKPIQEDANGVSWYIKDAKLYAALERMSIEKYFFPNRR